jgi:radical SAM-linked protein
VGLEDGFLAREYRKSLQSRLSPPCGKVAGAFVHENNVEGALAETRKLVCYDCGVACDMTQMRQERVGFLEKLGAHRPAPIDGSIGEDGVPARRLPLISTSPSPRGVPGPRTEPRQGTRYRLGFEKTGPVALLGHLDLIREIPRVFRRSGIEMAYTKGFHPKPEMMFAPALSLGVMSLDEAVDIRLPAALDDRELAELVGALSARAPQGLRFTRAARLEPVDPAISRVITAARWAIVFARGALVDLARAAGTDVEGLLAARSRDVMAATTLPVQRRIESIGKTVDVRAYLESIDPLTTEVGLAGARRAGLMGDLVGVEATTTISNSGAVKASEVAQVLLGGGDPIPHQAVRLALVSGPPGDHRGAFDLPALRGAGTVVEVHEVELRA